MNGRQARHRRAEAYLRQSYVEKILEAHAKGVYPPGQFSETWVYHDDDCPKLRGGLCNCRPALEVIYR